MEQDLIKYIDPRLMILIVFLWIIGRLLKLNPNFKDEWKIPFILWGIGIVFSVLWISVVAGDGFSFSILISGIVQGTLIAGASVLGNETLKQSIVKRIDDKKK